MTHSPSRSLFDFAGGGIERAQIFDVVTAAVDRGVQLEMDLVHPVDEVNGQVDTVVLGNAVVPPGRRGDPFETGPLRLGSDRC